MAVGYDGLGGWGITVSAAVTGNPALAATARGCARGLTRRPAESR